MGNKQLFSKSFVAVLAAAFSLAQAADSKATLEQQLESQYMLTTPTADNTDIVTMGSVLILQKKGFSAGAAANRVATQNTYKDGQIKSGAATAMRRFGGLPGISYIPGVGAAAGTAAGAAGASRDFVNGEKLYVTRISVDRSKDAIAFDLISDSYGDSGRYKGTLAFQFPKGTVTSADLAQVQPVIAQVFKIAPADDQDAHKTAAQQSGQQTASSGVQPHQAASASAPPPPDPPAPVAPPQPEAALAPIPPPPPPPPDPVVETKSIEVGQTKDQVTAILGKPDKTFKAGTKEIYQYKDIKVTFVNGKMTDAQ